MAPPGYPTVRTLEMLDCHWFVKRTDMLDTLPPHHLVKNLSALHTHKAVVHLWLPEWLQRLHVSETGVIAVECWARYRSI